jgi:hypothetical protein
MCKKSDISAYGIFNLTEIYSVILLIIILLIYYFYL